MKCSLLVLSSYLDGELEARREGELEAHLVGCQRCRAGLGYLREEVERVSTLGRVHVADHSVHALLTQLGLLDEDEPLPQPHAPVALAEPPPPAPMWMGADDAGTVPWEVMRTRLHRHGTPEDEADVAMTGTPDPAGYASGEVQELAGEDELAGADELPLAPPQEDVVNRDAPDDRPAFRWVPSEASATPEPPETPHQAPEENRPPFTWAPPPTAAQAAPPAGPAAPAEEAGVPAVPFGFESGRPGSLPPPSLSPPTADYGLPPPADDTTDAAPSATSGGAFPPGGPERIEPSEPPAHDPAPGGEPEMTASPPWTPREAPTAPLYPMTDEDVLGEPVPVERFGPPPQAARPSLFERLRDRLAVRRALARSSSAYDDQVQIVSGLGAPLHPGRARLEVERRRQETLRMDPGGIPGDSAPLGPSELDGDDPDDDLAGLGPLPPLPPRAEPMPHPSTHPGALPGQMALPGTHVGDPLRPSTPARDHVDTTRAPLPPVPMPPPRHSIGSVLGEIPPPASPRDPMPPRVPMPPHAPMPPVSPPPPPVPDPLAEALSGFDRDREGTTYEPRPWRPREIAEDMPPASPQHVAPAPPETAADRRRHSPSQLRDGRRLLAIFGAATLVMFVVGIASGRTVSPAPTNTGNAPTSSAPPQTKPKVSAPAAQSSTAPAPAPSNGLQQPPPAAALPQLTGVKTLGDSGTGYQVKDFRYGIHPNDFRIVLDLATAGAASGTPKATIGFADPTTIDVVLTGVVPAGSTGQLPSSNPVSGVTLLQPSPFPGAITYQIKLAHAATFSAGYVDTGAPLRLVIDIAG